MRLLGHPAHAALVHFPLALCATAVCWDLISLVTPLSWTAHLAFGSLVLGLIAAVPAVVTGLVDFARLPNDERIEATGYRHLWLMSLALGLYVGALLLRGGLSAASPERLAGSLGLSAVATLLLLAGAWHGGELVFRYGIGRTRSPDEPDVSHDANPERCSTRNPVPS